MSVDPTYTDDLSAALATYRETFGHPVPAEVISLFALHTGPLIMEIRQAIALGKPVPAWLARSRRTDISPFA